MINLGSISQVAVTAKSLSDLILITPGNPVGYQPQINPNLQGPNLKLPPAFFFDYEGEQAITLTSDITDHFVEDNTAIADQIALKPEEIIVTGFVGELNDIAPKPLALLKQASEKLTVVSAYVPVLSETAILLYNNAKFFYDTTQKIINNSIQTWQTLTTGKTTQTKQELAYIFFYGYWKDRTLFTIQTPYQVMENMVIKSLKAVQSAESNQFSDFEITFKRMRFAKSETKKLSQVLGVNLATRTDYQSSADSPVDLGSSTPEESGSLSDRLTGLA